MVSNLSCISKSPRELHKGQIPDIHPSLTNQNLRVLPGKISKFSGV